MKVKYMKHLIYSMVAFILFDLGISLQIKAGIGQSMLNAFALTLAELSHSEVGTILNTLNLLFFITYILIRKTRLDYKDIIQVIATIASGFIINLFVYSVLDGIVIETYLLRIVTFLSGLILASVSLGAVLAIGIIKFPLESLCIVLSQQAKKDLTAFRMGFDLFFLISTIIVTVISRNTLFIREGTIISFLLLSRLMGLTYNHLKKHLPQEMER